MRCKSKTTRAAKKVLRLSDLDHAKRTVLNTLGSAASTRAYAHAIDDFIDWYCSEPRLAFSKPVVLRYRIELETRRLSASTINLRLAAVRRLAYEAADTGLLSPELAAGIQRVKGAKRLGVQLGNWLTPEQCRSFLAAPDVGTVKGKHDRAILSLLLGCGLRRGEVASLEVNSIQQRDDHWAIVDLVGKGRHVRTVPVPEWVKTALDAWIAAAAIADGRLFRCVSRQGKVWGRRITEKVVWHIVKDCAKRVGIPQLAPHDCRRSCARLCHAAGGELEQIQFLLGHVSVETTERYLGCKQRLRGAVNDKIGLEPQRISTARPKVSSASDFPSIVFPTQDNVLHAGCSSPSSGKPSP